jgi:hypothetical protein
MNFNISYLFQSWASKILHIMNCHKRHILWHIHVRRIPGNIFNTIRTTHVITFRKYGKTIQLNMNKYSKVREQIYSLNKSCFKMYSHEIYYSQINTEPHKYEIKNSENNWYTIYCESVLNTETICNTCIQYFP